VPTVLPTTNVTFSFSLLSDPSTGPFTTTYNTSAGFTLNIRLNQVTAGPVSTVVVSFGDGSANQTVSSLVAGIPVNMSHNFTTGGIFTITGTVTGLTGLNTIVIPMIVNVAPPLTYSGIYLFFFNNNFLISRRF
jgi:hypothetical protein